MTKGHNPRKHVLLTSVHHLTLGSSVLNGSAYFSHYFLHHSEHNSGWNCLCTAFLLCTGAEHGRCRKQATGGTKRPEGWDGRAHGERQHHRAHGAKGPVDPVIATSHLSCVLSLTGSIFCSGVILLLPSLLFKFSVCAPSMVSYLRMCVHASSTYICMCTCMGRSEVNMGYLP